MRQALEAVRHYGSAVKALADSAHDSGTPWQRALGDKQDLRRAADEAQREADWCAEHQVRILSLTDTDYPVLLAECPDAPLVLFYRGTARLNRRYALSVVGTRRITPYGKRLCEELCAGLATLRPDALIVSGLAYGVDVHAHRAALAHGMETVAVLAHGHDRLYPSLHRDTANAMLSQGGLLTEYPAGTVPDKGNFVRRNRIVAGLTAATLVVESAQEGGALITARLASGYNREVAAFPGRATDEYSEGCNRLIRENRASLVTSPADVLELLGWESAEQAAEKEKEPQLFPSRTPEQERVLEALHGTDGLSFDQLLRATGIPLSRLSALLFDLELDGGVSKLVGNRYILR